ncbi:hypothetical protein ACFWBG_14855 [Nocardia salmonicida]|uniref:hypothetical protein n=1 Tax=Nocardia salmonicida TaxID=53431 RepID=UPI0036729DB2
MAHTHFVFVIATVIGDATRSGHVFTDAWLLACGEDVRRYWQEMSGFREDLTWSIHPPVEIDQPYTDADVLAAAVRAKAAAEGAPFTQGDVLVVIQDWAAAEGGQFGSDGQFAAADLSPSLLCHELGHFYQRRNHQPRGHASTFNGHIALDYEDPTCIMGSVGPLAAQEPLLAHAQPNHDLTGPAMCPAATVPIGWLDRDHPTATVAVPRQPTTGIQLARWAGAPAAGYTGLPVVAVGHSVCPGGADVYISLRSPRVWDRGFRTLTAQGMQRQIVAQELARSGATFLLAQVPVQPGSSARLGRAPLRIDVLGGGDAVAEIDVVPDPWRLWSVLESPPLHRAARIAAVAREGDIDLFVIGLDGAVLQARFTGGVWLPWQALTDPHTFDPRAGIAAATSTPNTIDLFVVGQGDHLVRRRRSTGDQWAPDWQVLTGGRLSERSSLAATATAPGRVELFAGDADGAVTHATVTDDASGWSLLPALPRAGSLAAVTLSGNTIQLSVVTEGPGDGRIWTIVGQPDQWPTPWEPHPDVGLAEDGGVAAARSTPGVSELVAAATPLAARSYANGAWTGQPIRVPGQPPATNNRTVAAVFRSATVLDVFAVADGKIHRITRSFDPDVVQTDAQARKQYRARIVASGGRFVRVSEDPLTRDLLIADEYLPTPATVFTIDELAYYTSWGTRTVVSIRAHDGRYVMALDGGGEWLRVGAAALGPWEKFVVTTSGGTSTLMALGGHYWSAQGGDSWLLCDRVAVGPWERFDIARL